MDNKIGDIIQFYAEHNISENIKQRFFERLSESTYDQEVDAALHKLWDKADSAFMDDEEITSALNHFNKESYVDKTTKAKTTKIWRIAAIVIPLLLLTALYSVYYATNSRQNEAQETTMLQAHTINGEEKTLTLGDGTKIKLGPGSVLLYPQNFTGNERKVFLTGEAFFDIKHDDKKPFHVSTSFFDITDLGTSFGVTAYADAEEVSTTLKSGKIELRLNDNSKRVYEMNPEDRFIYNVQTKESRMERVENKNGATWKNAQIDLNDITLSEAARILERTYGKKFVLLSKHAAQTRITIHYNKGENLQSVLSIIADLIPGMKYHIKQDAVIIK